MLEERVMSATGNWVIITRNLDGWQFQVFKPGDANPIAVWPQSGGRFPEAVFNSENWKRVRYQMERCRFTKDDLESLRGRITEMGKQRCC